MLPLTPEDWSRIRYEYEQTRRPVEDICHAYGITPNTLRRRGRRWGWSMRQPPIPDEGPPALAMPSPPAEPARFETVLPAHEETAVDVAIPVPASPRSSVEDGRERPAAGGGREDVAREAFGAVTGETESILPDPATIPDRLRGALARVLAAIEATLARLTHGPQHPRDLEQTARTLSVLMRTLRELTSFLAEQQKLAPTAPAPDEDDDPIPDNIDEFRFELARRINAFLAGENASAAVAAQGDAENGAC